MEKTFPEIVRCGSPSVCHAAILVMLERVVLEAIDRQGYCTIVLAGGKTPEPLYRLLATAPLATRIPWRKVYFFFGDERCVSPEHPASNYKMAWDTLLSKLPITPGQVFRMPVEIRPYSAAAQHYQHSMGEAFAAIASSERPRGEGECPAFDLILLGMGVDGHTASLFPCHPALSSTEWVTVVEAEGSEPPVPRLTLTLPVLNNADTVLFLVGGAEKIRVAQSFLAGQPQARFPASLVRPRHRLLWYLIENE